MLRSILDHRRPSIKARFFKTPNPFETERAPVIKAKLAAIGTRRLGNADYVRVADVNPFIFLRTHPELPKPLSEIDPARKSSHTESPTAFAANLRGHPVLSDFPAVLKRADADGGLTSRADQRDEKMDALPRNPSERDSTTPQTHFAVGRAQSMTITTNNAGGFLHELDSKKTMNTEQQNVGEVAGTTKLMISNLDYVEVGMKELVEPFTKFGKIKEAFLSKPTVDGHKNAGWAILVTDEETARKILAATIVIANRVVRVTKAKPKVE